MTPYTPVEASILANTSLLHAIEKRPLLSPLPEEVLREAVFIDFHRRNFSLPDHVFNYRWQALKQELEGTCWPTIALEKLSKSFLNLENSKITAKLSSFGDWQNLLSRMSGVPIQASLLSTQIRASISATIESCATAMNNTTLAYPHATHIESYIASSGLNDTHLHLNGTTSAESCWYRALIDPDSETLAFSQAYKKNSQVRELCHALDSSLNPAKHLQRLKVARRIRALLLVKCEKTKNELLANICDLKESSTTSKFITEPLEQSKLREEITKDLVNQQPHHVEAAWMSLLISKLNEQSDPLAEHFFHIYLLIQNQYIQLLVQRDDFFGFDQFQKFTLTELREPAEREYKERFKQLHGGPVNSRSRVNRLDGRFAPKKSVGGNLKILDSIARGYAAYLTQSAKKESSIRERLRDALDSSKPKGKLDLALTIHFIKKEWGWTLNKGMGYRHQQLRKDLLLQISALKTLKLKIPNLEKIIKGIDAAANELHAGAEVFSPMFRACETFGLKRKTFHVGEDFIHIISGMRQISDAITFLDLSRGDRIGHGIAIGIDPKVWLRSMTPGLYIKQGEWLLDLIFVSQALDGDKSSIQSMKLQKDIRIEIVRISKIVFGFNINYDELILAMSYRDLWPPYVFECLDSADWFWQTASLDDHWQAEAKKISLANETNRPALELLASWWRNPDLHQLSEKMIPIDTNLLSSDVLLALQKHVQERIKKKGIFVEALPTSNVRISQYKHIREHHIFEWLQVEKKERSKKGRMNICLGSDDPGIFSTDIVAEYYHLYSVLINEHGLKEQDALKVLKDLNIAGFKCSFH